MASPNTRSLLLVAALGLAVTAAACSSDDDESGASGCPDDKAYFQDEVWSKVLGNSCVNCHSAGGPAQGTRLVLSRAAADADRNFEVVSKLARSDGRLLLVQKPTGAAGSHGGGALLDPASPEAAVLQGFLDRQDGKCSASVSAASLNQRQIRRLTRDEYGNTLQDLLGVSPALAEALPADTVADGFDNQAGALQMSTLFVDKARANAEEIGKTVDLARLATCQPANGAEATCADQSIRDLGGRAFRRPMSDIEVARYRVVYDVSASEGFEAGMRAVVTAMLQSPSFLFRTELGTHGKDGWDELTPFEIASELSYLFWKTMPDEELFASARSGDLAKKDVVMAQTARLLASPKARASMARFVEQWLELDRLPQAVKDEATYPGFDDALRADLHAETVELFDRVARSPEGSFKELLTADYTYATGKAAQFYGIAGSSGAKSPTDGRLGILTHAGVLATAATPSSGSPVRRGKLVREKFLCQSMPPPPPGLSAMLPPVDPKLANRERFTQHSQDQACASCHRLMDPVGFGFEGFDGIGKPVAGANVAGEILGTDRSNGTFAGVNDLASKLADSPDAQECFARLWVRYAYGIKESSESRSLGVSVAHALATAGTKIAPVFTSLVQADHLFKRRTDADEGQGAAPAAPPATSNPVPPAADAGAPPSGPTTGTSPGLDVKVEDIPMGNSGFQKNVTVTNQGTTGIDWKVKLPRNGTITNSWNTDYTVAPDGWLFVGKDYNRHLEPGQVTSFGFQGQ